MNIDLCINDISEDKLIGSGYEKKCYDFGDVVLLESRYLSKNKLESEKNDILIMKKILDSIDVNGYKIFDYKIFNDKLYILESKVSGSVLQDDSLKGTIDEYIIRLGELDNYLILKKFVMDCFTILNNGLSIDFGRPNNFLFDKEKGISFIDLSVAENSFDFKNLCFYIFYDLIYTHFDARNREEYEIISNYYHNIYDKLCSIFIELGYDASMYSMSPNGTISSFIERKLDRLYNKKAKVF